MTTQTMQEELSGLQGTRAGLEQKLLGAQVEVVCWRQKLREAAFRALVIEKSDDLAGVLKDVDEGLAGAEGYTWHVQAALEQCDVEIGRVKGEMEEAGREAIREEIRALILKHQEFLEAGRVEQADGIGRQLQTLRKRYPDLDAEVREAMRGKA